MAKKGVIKYISFMFLLITTLIAIFTLFGLFGGTADPAKGTAMAMLVYILPFLIAGNIATMSIRMLQYFIAFIFFFFS